MLSTSNATSSHGACTSWAGSSPFAQQQGVQGVAPGTTSPPVSSNHSAGTAVVTPGISTGSQSGSPSGSTAETPYSAGLQQPQPQQQQQGYASMMGGSGSKRFSASRYIQDKEWLYRLITFPSYFTPCPSCCGGARMPKREQLMTQFDTEAPYRVYCSHCPECKDRVNSGCLLQVRRSAFKDVVKATDIQRFGADVAGVQQYTLNGSKVIYLNREQTPEKKSNNTNAAPAACSVDGRAMMDKSSSYCSLKCKLIAEDAGFTRWLDTQDPSVRIMAQAAANAPPRPTAASKRAAQPTSSASSGGSGTCSPLCEGSGVTSGTSRPFKCARTLGSSAMTDSAAAAAATRVTGLPLQRAATATAAPSAAPAGLKRIRISLPSKRQASAPSGLLEAALSAEAAASDCTAATAAAAVAAGSWLDMENAMSCSAAWDSWDLDASLDSPCFTAAPSNQQLLQQRPACASDAIELDGSMSPALIHAPTAFSSGSFDDWWLCGSPLEGAFTSAGMGALLNPDASLVVGCGGAGGVGELSSSMLLPPMGTAAGSPCSQGAETTAAAGLSCW